MEKMRADAPKPSAIPRAYPSPEAPSPRAVPYRKARTSGSPPSSALTCKLNRSRLYLLPLSPHLEGKYPATRFWEAKQAVKPPRAGPSASDVPFPAPTPLPGLASHPVPVLLFKIHVQT